jgi:ribosomal protein L32
LYGTISEHSKVSELAPAIELLISELPNMAKNNADYINVRDELSHFKGKNSTAKKRQRLFEFFLTLTNFSESHSNCNSLLYIHVLEQRLVSLDFM